MILDQWVQLVHADQRALRGSLVKMVSLVGTETPVK